MSLRFAILGVLEARPMTGYELTRFFESSASWVWSAPQSQIYPLLRKLDDEGLIQGEGQVRGTKLRRVQYSLTGQGMTALRRWLSESREAAAPRDSFLVQALFLDLIDPSDAAAVVHSYIADLRAQSATWAVHQARLRARETPLLIERLRRRDPADHERIANIKSHVFGALVGEAEQRIAWAEELLEILGPGGAAPPS